MGYSFSFPYHRSPWMLQPGKQVWRTSTEARGTRRSGDLPTSYHSTSMRKMRGDTGMLFGPEGGYG